MRPDTPSQESPDFVKLSLAAAMVLELKSGRFYRNARLGCVNLLLTYQEGCLANCSYCGLARGRGGAYEDKSFIRVKWPVYPVDEVVRRLDRHRDKVSRVCLSMITHPRAREDTLILLDRVRGLGIPISLLCVPTLMREEDLETFRQAGVRRLGIAVDVAGEALFDRHRGLGVRGPHDWDQYWKIFDRSVQVFGRGMVGVHVITGLGETEGDLVRIFTDVRARGGVTHLFSFCPEPGSRLAGEGRQPPPMGSYRRVQLARYLVDVRGAGGETFSFAEDGCLTGFGIGKEAIETILQDGRAFFTSGCPDETTGEVACTRPFGNAPPGPEVRNFPYPLDDDDRARIRLDLGL